MHDIFFSYSREDRDRAERLAHELEAHGWSVWWDRSIPAGRTFDEVIEEAIEASRCVVVLWSRHSVESRWVRTEAQEGLERDALMPVLIDEVKVPLAFRRVQAADMVAWAGDSTDPIFRDFVRDLESLVGSPEPVIERRAIETPTHLGSRDSAPVAASSIGDSTTVTPPSAGTPAQAGPESWLDRHPRVWTGLRTGLVGGLASGALGLLIFANDSRDFINPYFAALGIGAWAGISWIFVGMAAGPRRPGLVGAVIGAVLAMLAWTWIGGTYEDVLGAAVMVGGPVGGLLGALLSQRVASILR